MNIQHGRWIRKGLLLFCVLIFHPASWAQTLIQDSLKIPFEDIDFIEPLHATMDTVIDQRNEDARVIGEYEITKYGFIPVDLMLYTEKPVADEILDFIPFQKNTENLHFILGISEFKLTKHTNSLLFPRYQLNACVNLYRRSQDENESNFIGQFVYETCTWKPLVRDKYERGFSKVIKKWQRKFAFDLAKIDDDLAQNHSVVDNFRVHQYAGKTLNLITGADVAIGTNSTIMDAQIFFSQREANRKFFRSGGYNVRYRTASDFESIEFGLSNDYLFYRFHPSMVCRGKSLMLLGANRWKDIDTIAHKIYDAVIIEYSLSQSVFYNVLDKRSLIFGIGVQENFYYIYSRDFHCEIGLLFHAGIKL